MNLSRFLTEREPVWRELDELLAKAGTKPDRLPPADLRLLGARYREAAADLALARRRFAGDPVVRRLEQLVARGRAVVYGQRSRAGSIVRFFARDYWQAIAERPWSVVIAWACLLVGAALAAGWALADPDAAAGLLPQDFSALADENPDGREALGPGDSSAFASYLFTHNIQVSFLGFAAGITAGIGTGLLILYNGVILGAVAGLTIGNGNGRFFAELVAAHGVIEISCIVVTAAAGMRMGWALVDPGTRRTRGEALTQEARRAVLIVLGTIPWLIFAGITESAITPRLSAEMGVIFGFAVAAVFWGLVVALGRPRHSERDVTPLPALQRSPASR